MARWGVSESLRLFLQIWNSWCYGKAPVIRIIATKKWRRLLRKFTSILGLWLSASCCSHCLVFPLTSSWFVSSRISSRLIKIIIFQFGIKIYTNSSWQGQDGWEMVIWMQTSVDDLLPPCDATSCASLFEPTLQTIKESNMNMRHQGSVSKGKHHFLWNVFSRSIASPPQPPTPVCKFKIWCASFLWSLEHRSPNDLKQPLCSGKCFRKRGTITKAPLSWYLHKSDQKLTYEPSQHEVGDICIVHVTLYWLLAPIAFLCSAEMGGFDELGLEGAGFFGLST